MIVADFRSWIDGSIARLFKSAILADLTVSQYFFNPDNLKSSTIFKSQI